SAAALRVTLVMPVGALSVAAVNVTAPKIPAAALVQRSIAGRPGEWGVAGTMAVLASVLALWLITERASFAGHDEHALSLRRAARWAGVLTCGAVVGALLSWNDGYVYPRDGIGRMLLLGAVLLCELPSGALRYVYLKRLAAQLGDRRAAAMLSQCAWAT